MPELDNQQYLKTEQYRDASNLNARIALHARFSTNKYGWLRWVFDQLDLAPASRILEVGCGPASLWITNRARIPAGWRPTLVDLSLGMAREARQGLADTRPAFRFAVADAQALPFPTGQFDAVIANHMLYHVPDRRRALGEIRRVLRPGGRLFAATNGQGHLEEMDQLLERFDPAIRLGRPAPTAVPQPPGSIPAAPFDLEHAGAELAAQFTDVEMRRYDDALRITEAAPLVAYVLSTGIQPNLAGGRAQDFARFIAQELAAHGAIHITKSTGLFLAHCS